MNKLTKEEIKNLTYNNHIIEIDDRILGYISKNDLVVWTLINGVHYTDDLDFCDEKMSKKHNITVGELRALRLKEQEKLDKYFVKNKIKKINNKKKELINKIKIGINLNNKLK